MVDEFRRLSANQSKSRPPPHFNVPSPWLARVHPSPPSRSFSPLFTPASSRTWSTGLRASDSMVHVQSPEEPRQPQVFPHATSPSSWPFAIRAAPNKSFRPQRCSTCVDKPRCSSSITSVSHAEIAPSQSHCAVAVARKDGSQAVKEEDSHRTTPIALSHWARHFCLDRLINVDAAFALVNVSLKQCLCACRCALDGGFQSRACQSATNVEHENMVSIQNVITKII